MKFGRYLQENLTPEWKRAYIDYRGCKKAIKVVAARLGQVKEGKEDDDRDSSGADDDNGPSAPPRRSPETMRGSLRSRAGTDGATPRLTKVFSRPSPATAQSHTYGSTGTSPRPRQSPSLHPPPLNLGPPGVDDDYPSLHPQQEDEPPSASSGSNVRSPSQTRKGVAFSPTAQEVGGQPISESPEASGGSGSSEDGMVQSDSAEPLTKKTPSNLMIKTGRVAPSPRMIGKSPRGLFTPKLSGLGGSPGGGDTPMSRTGKSPARSQPRSLRSMTLPSPALGHRSPASSRPPETFEDLYNSLEEDEAAFFDLLERELDKVETFYVAREEEAKARARELRAQLRELAEHRKLYHELYPEGMPEWEAKVGRILPSGKAVSAPSFSKLRSRLKFVFDESDASKKDGDEAGANGALSRTQSPVMDARERSQLQAEMTADKNHQTYNPERYQRAKKDLKTAVLEYYRQLELIKNYRILNLTGFRKALKKFEKTTKIHCMELYTDERISKCTFSKSDSIDELIKQVEDLYTLHFEHGDSKRARDKLRKQTHEKTHYQSVFRSGIMLGIGLPAAIAALVETGKHETRRAIPAWEGLLQAYGGLFLPVIFAMLFELNLMAYVSARINYEFVMELTRPTIDYRSFLELPAFLFMTLSYCFYFSFARIGASNVAPTTWPAAWLVFFAVFWLNPLPIFRRQTRYWLLKVLFRVVTPGYSRVEFIAFFVADELNSLIYSIQNIFFVSCAYAHKWPGDVFNVCHSGKSWPYALLLCLPALSRFIQCLKRFKDSRLKIHLINAGKYLSVITQQCLFVFWRSKGSRNDNASFIIWVIFATLSAMYTCSWDFVVDWSLLRPRAGLLRKDLGYSQRAVYYLAMVINFLIRFIFVWYIPQSQTNVRTRSFFFALAEMLRRWQWNFFRVETEHLGNADAYRVTREVPLPYRRVEHDSDSENEPSIRNEKGSKSGSVKGRGLSVNLDRLRRGARDQRDDGGRGPDALNVGARGHEGQREYEARRPGDDEGRFSGEEAV
ncbi:hypothetical protein IAT38_006654 [Cryptococcus sp. DSM 104549]